MEPRTRLFRPDVGGPDHLAPLLGFVRDVLAEFGDRHWHWNAAKLGNPRPHRWIGQRCIDFSVERLNNSGWRVHRCTEAKPDARFIIWYELADGRNVRQRVRVRCGRHRQPTQLARRDVPDRSWDREE